MKHALEHALLLLSFLELLLSGSLQRNLENKDEFCNRVSSISTTNLQFNSPDLCHRFGSSGKCKTEILKFLVSQDLASEYHPVLDCTCVSDVALKWQRECMSIIDKGLPLIHEHKINSEDQPPFKSVDYLFLLEINCVHDRSVTDEILGVIQSLLKQTNDKQIFQDASAQVGVVLYSSTDKIQFLYARDFSSQFPSDIASFLESKVNWKDCVSPQLSIETGVRVMTRTLGLINREKKFKHRIKLASNKSVVFWHRPYSDLHIVSVLGSSTRHDSNDDDGGSDRDTVRLQQSFDKVMEQYLELLHVPVSLHVVFDKANSVAVLSLGDPSLARRYLDCSHFRKAQTLKALIAAKLGSTLQASLISKGVEFQVHAWEDFKDTFCVLNMCPSLSALYGLSSSFPNKCLLRYGNHYSSKKWYCSELHGWTRKENRKAKIKDFEDVVPLPVAYGSDHADLISTAAGPSDKQGQIELSINQKSESDCKNCPGLNIVGEPRTVQWSSDKPFVREMLDGKVPVVLRGTVAQKWKALESWDMAYLSKNMGTDVLKSVKCTDSYLTFDPDHRSALKLNISLPYSVANMSTSQFFECVESEGPCVDGLKGHYYFGTVPETLKEDVQPNRPLYNTEEDFKAGKQFMWISSAGMITHAHFDQDYNFFVQLVGEKRFTFWSPEQHELMYVYPRVHPLWHKSRINFRDVDVQRFPGFTRARGLQVKLGPGDMLYVPPYTWHYVETLSPSVSLSTWSHDYSLYDHMNSVYKHDHKFDLLQSKRGNPPMQYCVLN